MSLITLNITGVIPGVTSLTTSGVTTFGGPTIQRKLSTAYNDVATDCVLCQFNPDNGNEVMPYMYGTVGSMVTRPPIGVITSGSKTGARTVSVNLLGVCPGTILITAAESITAGDSVYALKLLSGQGLLDRAKIYTTLPSSFGISSDDYGAYCVGVAITSGVAGEKIEVATKRVTARDFIVAAY
jgi:hypothetical protein